MAILKTKKAFSSVSSGIQDNINENSSTLSKSLLSIIDRSTQTSALQIKESSARDKIAKSISSLTLEQAADKINMLSKIDIDSKIKTSSSVLSKTSNIFSQSTENIKQSKKANEILKSIDKSKTVDIINDFSFIRNATKLNGIVKKDIIKKTNNIVVSSSIENSTSTDIRSVEREVTTFFSDPVLFSGSFSIGSDSYNIDTFDKDLRSYNSELLSSFDQISFPFTECEIISLIKNEQNKVIIVFRLGEFDNFMIKIFDMFYDRKVFYNGYSTIDSSNLFLNSPFVSSMSRTDPPSDFLAFNRNQAKEAVVRNKDTIEKYGINIGLKYSIFGSDSEIARATKLLEIGAFDYNYNPNIQNDTIFIHKIFGIDLASTIGGTISTSTSTPVVETEFGPSSVTTSTSGEAFRELVETTTSRSGTIRH